MLQWSQLEIDLPASRVLSLAFGLSAEDPTSFIAVI